MLAIRCKKNIDPICKLAHMMDFSNYKENHPLYSKKRKNKLTFFKNEMPGDRILEFVGVRSKAYSFRSQNAFESKCKGVKKSYKNKLSFALYKKCLTDISRIIIQQKTLRSQSFDIYKESQKKVALTSFDDKRVLLSCGIHSVPYGYKLRVKQKCLECEKNPELYL